MEMQLGDKRTLIVPGFSVEWDESSSIGIRSSISGGNELLGWID